MSIRVASRVALVALAFFLVAGVSRAAVPFKKADLFRVGRASAKAGDFERASAAFEDMARAEGASYTLQLVVVCEASTLAKLVDAPDSDKGLYFLSTRVNGRDCYRAFWGVYGSADAAKASLKSVPSGLVDQGKPPIAVALGSVLTVELAAPTLDESRAQAKTITNASLGAGAPSPSGGQVFTDKDLTNYRKNREDDEKKYGVPKALFEDPGLDDAKRSKKGAKGPPVPAPKVEEVPPAPGDDRSYWATLSSNARQAVNEKREAVNAAERDVETARTKLSQAVDAPSKQRLENEKKAAEDRLERTRAEQKAAEQALAELKDKAIAKGAKAEWLQ